MITYKDKTFCADEVEEHICGRELTEAEKAEAERMGLPISYGSFCALKDERVKELAKSSFLAGRQSVFDELEEEQKKFLQGFGYRKHTFPDPHWDEGCTKCGGFEGEPCEPPVKSKK